MLCQMQVSNILQAANLLFSFRYVAQTQGQIPYCHKLILEVLWPHCYFSGILGHIEMVLKQHL